MQLIIALPRKCFTDCFFMHLIMDMNMAVTVEGIEVIGNLATKVAFFWDGTLLITSPACK